MLFPKPWKSKKWNTKRLITKETKEIVYERDGGKCVFCWRHTQDHFHHLYWWIESEYSEDRNRPEAIVLACSDCHTLCHKVDTNKYRKLGKDYIQHYYEQINFLSNYVSNNTNETFSSGQE